MTTTVTGKAIRQTLITLVGGLMDIGQQVGAGGTTSSIVDTNNLKGRALAPGMYDNAILRVSNAANAALIGQSSYVDYVDPSTGTMNFDPAFTAALADGDEYEVWMKGVDPDYVDRLRDDCLQYLCSTWRIQPITVITDGDMDAANVNSWTVVAGATRTKVFGASPDTKSRRQLSVIHTTAATDFVDSTILAVQPGENYFLEVPVRAYVTATDAAATASIQVIDITNGSATVPLGGVRLTHTGKGWGRIALYFAIPTNSYTIKLRLKSDTNASTTQWGGICMNHRDATEITLPDRVRTKKRVGRTFWTTQVTPATGWVNNTRYKLREYKNVERVQIGANVNLFCMPGFGNNAVYYYERGYFDRLSVAYITPAQRAVGDAATTDCPIEYIAAVLAEQLTKRQLDKFGSEWQDDWVRASSWSNYFEGEFGPEPVHIQENEQPVYIPNLRI